MPWSKVDGSEVEECNDDQIAVVKDEDGTVEGCHDTEEEANDQIAALEASENGRMNERAIALGKLRSAVRNRVYDMDGPQEDWFVKEVMVDGIDGDGASGTTIAYERESDTSYSIDYEYDGDDVTLAERDDWTEVEQTWEPVDIERMKEKKRSASPSTARNGVQRRSIPVNVRENEDKDTVTFEISNDGLDRHGTILNPGGARTDNFESNPVVLFNHGRGPQGSMPIGRAPSVFTRDDSLFAEVRFDGDDDFASEVERKVRNGFLNAASVGFEPIEQDTRVVDGDEVPAFEEWELVEFSIVPVPSNPDALVEGRNDPYVEEMADRVAERVQERLDLNEEDAASADAVGSEDGSDDPDPAGEVDDDDSQADDSRNELVTKMRLAAKAKEGQQGVDEDRLFEQFQRKLGKK